MTNRSMKKSDSWFRFENKGPKNAAKVYIYDDIGEYGVTAADFARELDALGEDTDIELHLNTPGGFVYEGIAIHTNLKQRKAKVTAYVDGLAASAGSAIAMAADEVIIARNAQFMIHNASGLCAGTSKDMAWMAEALEKQNTNLADMYVQKAGKDEAYWLEYMDAETFFSAQEAVKEGLADKILGEEKDEPQEEKEAETEEKEKEEVVTAHNIDVVGLKNLFEGVWA